MEAGNNQSKKPIKPLAILIIILLIAAAFAGYQINKRMKINAELAAVLANGTELNQDSGTSEQSAAWVSEGYVLTGILNPVTSYNITARVSGQVVEVYKQKGDPVKTGDLLAQQDATDVLLAAGQGSTTTELLQRLKEAYDLAEDTYQKNKALYEAGVIAESTLKQLETQRENARLQYEGTAKYIAEQTAKAAIKSPGSGVLASLNIQEGDYITAGTAIASVVDISQLILKGNIEENVVSQISLGDKVKVTVNPLGKTFDGVVTFISPVALASGQMFPIEISVNNDNEEIKAGMSASAIITK